MQPTITICTDASFMRYDDQSIATWACYIRTPTKTIKQSGVIREPVRGSTQAELMGLANALYIANQSEDLTKHRVIVYCDNIVALKKKRYTKHGPKSRYYQSEVEKMIWHDTYILPYIQKAMEYDSRHVKGHMPKSQWENSLRHFMNDWCDREAQRVRKLELHRLKMEVRSGAS